VRIRLFQVDAFATRLFEGNPAAVCPLRTWLSDEVLQDIAGENNLSETAFFVSAGSDYELRWFTPTVEVELCGHATLAAAHVLFEHLDYASRMIRFNTRGGDLIVQRKGDRLEMVFPARVPQPCAAPPALSAGLGTEPLEVLRADDYIAVFDSEATIRALVPDMARLSTLDRRGVSVTARGSDVDFVSRFFAPAVGVPEDPVTGSAHCELAPFWASRLGKSRMHARQVSRRGGEVFCELRDNRVVLEGRAVTFLEGEIRLDDSC